MLTAVDIDNGEGFKIEYASCNESSDFRSEVLFSYPLLTELYMNGGEASLNLLSVNCHLIKTQSSVTLVSATSRVYK